MAKAIHHGDVKTLARVMRKLARIEDNEGVTIARVEIDAGCDDFYKIVKDANDEFVVKRHDPS